MTFESRRRGWVLVACLVLMGTSPARAGNLSDIIPNLFGRDGITNFPSTKLGCCPQGHQPHFRVDSDGQLTSLNDALRGQLANIPLPSPASSFTYQLDPGLGVFVRSTESFGPIYADRAETLGRGKFSLGFGYSHFGFDQLDGKDLDNGEVALTFRHEPTSQINTGVGLPNNGGKAFAFEKDTVTGRIFADIDLDIFLVTATYGILDNLDVSLAIPIIRVAVEARGVAVSNNESNSPGGIHTFTNGSNTFVTSTVSDESTGIGDILLRGKYNVYRQKPLALAAALELRLPTGDEDNLRGVGSVRVRPFFVASGGSWAGFSPHVNVGFDLGDSSTVDNEFIYKVGFDWAALKRLTFVFDILGRHILDNSRLQADGRKADDDIVDASVGVKINPWGNVLILANVLFPLNSTGLRADFVPYIGVEVNF